MDFITLGNYPAPVVRVQVMREASCEVTVIRRPAQVAEVVRGIVGGDEREYLVAFALNVKNHLIGIIPVSVGAMSSSIVHPREVFRAAILMGASGIIVAHNHPSGDPEPSPEDISVTTRLAEAGGILGIDVLDHIIVGGEKYISLWDRGYIGSASYESWPKETR